VADQVVATPSAGGAGNTGSAGGAGNTGGAGGAGNTGSAGSAGLAGDDLRIGALGDPRFFRRAGPFSLALVAETAGAPLPQGADAGAMMTGVAPLQAAGPADITFLHNRKYIAALAQTRAGAVIVTPHYSGRVPAGTVALVMDDPHVGWARVASLFHPAAPVRAGVHGSAVIDPTAQVDPTAEIGPLAVIGAGAVIGPDCRIGAGAVIGDGVIMGGQCRVGPLASISHAILGARVYVYPGARIGQEGFGFAITAQGFLTVPQLGRVILEDDVEIGANSTVDRGAALDTVIGAGSRIDNLVQIGHGVRMGKGCVLAGQAGIAGSTVLGDFVQIGAQAGLAGHLSIGTKARIGAQCGLMSDLESGAEVVGSPAMPVREFFRNVAVLRKLARKPGTPS
jgi:UDP-3-O-[3-hydroxymyristoyl] glucosamine N-acyltransferase